MSFKVIGIGEALWDLLPSGPQLGGAPANFAFHARQLGAAAQVITRVGNDDYGHRIIACFADMNIHGGTVQIDDRLPTGTAGIILGSDGAARFTLRDNVAWDGLQLTDAALRTVCDANAICFGTLAQRNPSAAAAIQQLVAATPAGCLRVLDINLRQGFYSRELIKRSLELATIVKLNDHELTILSDLFHLTGDTCHQVEQLADQFGQQLVALTRGENGSALFQAGHWSDLPGSSIKISDTIGAGDSFTATMVMGLLNGVSLEEIHRIAAAVANYVCTCPGAMPVLPESLRAAFALHCKHP